MILYKCISILTCYFQLKVAEYESGLSITVSTGHLLGSNWLFGQIGVKVTPMKVVLHSILIYKYSRLQTCFCNGLHNVVVIITKDPLKL